jgi:hypothetical protein
MKISADSNFGMRECPSCATEIPVNNNRCPICGYLFPTATSSQRHVRFWGAIIMLLLFVILILRLL